MEGRGWVNRSVLNDESKNTLFAVQDNGSRFRSSQDSDNWQRLEFLVPRGFASITATKDRLYVVARNAEFLLKKRRRDNEVGGYFAQLTWGIRGKILRQQMLGKNRMENQSIVAAGETVIAMEQGMVRHRWWRYMDATTRWISSNVF